MNIIISNANNRPIYEQIYLQIKSAIISADLHEGDLLPSIRNLAKDLRISVITTKRAYDELEKEGYIYSVAGKGSYVAEKNTEILREAHLKEIEEHIRKILQIAPSCKLQTKDIITMFKIISEEE
ncbi:MAG: GntR family transcriptional regulator [Candidatus Neomarinimicrobiota bacterium]|nr:GntR family transcriptional regulator [Clostridia bacterium]